MSDSPPRATGSACGSNVGSPSQAWGQQGFLERGDAGSTAGSVSAPSRPAGTSSSPWQFQLNVQAANRVRSGERSGNLFSTPVLNQRYAAPRAVSSQPGARAPASYESALLSAVRRQIETFEEKVGTQISSLRDQQQGDRLREAAFARLEEKMNTAEGMQPRLDRRLAELTGNFKGLSDEMQAQIRRVDLMDERLWEWRRQFEEEFRQKHAELETHIQKVPSSIRVMATTMEESQKRLASRLHRLEADAGERNALHDETRETLSLVCTKFEALESQRVEDHASLIEAAKASLANSLPTRGGLFGNDDSALVSMLEQRFDDLVDKVERMFQDTHDVHARLAAQEEQQKTMRTLFETTDGHVRSLKEVVEGGNWDSKTEHLQQAILEEGRHRLEHLERLELLSKRVEYHEQAQEELRNGHHMHMRGLDGEDGGLAATLQECAQRLEQAEANLELLNVELEAVRADSGLGSRVSELVLQLKEVGPKVMDHERFIKEMRLESHHRGDGLASERLKQLEDEMAKLSDKVAQVMSGSSADPHNSAAFEIELLKQDLSALKAKPLDAHPAVVADLEAVKQDLGALKAQPREVHPTVAADLETLKQDLGALKARPHDVHPTVVADLEALKQDLGALKAQPRDLHPAVTADLETLKHDLSALKARPHDVHPTVVADLEALKQDLGALKAQPREVHPTVAADLETLKHDLSALKAQPHDVHPTVVADLEALKQDLGALKAQPRDLHPTVAADLETLKHDLSALKARPHDVHPTVVADLEALKQDLGALKAQPHEAHPTVAADLETLKHDLSALKARPHDMHPTVVADLEALKQDLSALKAQPQDAHPSVLADLEALRQDVGSLKARPQVSSEDLAPHLEPLKQELRSFAEAAPPARRAAEETELELARLSETAEANKQIATSISGEIEGLRRDLDTLRDSSHQALKKELDEVRALAEAGSAEASSTELLKEELQRIMSVSSASKDAAASAVGEVQALREDLVSVKAKMEAGSIEHAGSVEFQGSVELLKQEIQRIVERSLSSKDVAATAMSELQGLREDLASTKATVEAASTEPLKQELQRLLDLSSSSRDVAAAASSELRGLREDLCGIKAKVEASEVEAARTAAGSLQQEALREEWRREIEACRSASEASLREHVRPVAEELQILTDVSRETQRAVSGALGELGALGQQLAEAQASREQGELKEELRSVTEAMRWGQEAAASALKEVEGLRQHVLTLADGGRGADGLRQVEGLKVEVEDAKRRANEVTMQMEAVKQQAMEAHSVSTGDVQRLKADLQSLQVRVASAPAPTGGEMNDLAAELAQEEEAEGRAHSQMELRIEEVCRRLTEVDEAIAASAAAAPQAGSGIPASFADKFEAVVRQVEQLQHNEHRIKAKLDLLI